MTGSRVFVRDAAFCIAAFIVLYLFYRSLYVIAAIPVFYYFYRKYSRKELRKNYINQLDIQFKDSLISLAAALRAGYSIENSIKESYSEMAMMYGENSPICRELNKMINSMKLGIPLEKLFFSMASESGSEEIEIFASVFSIAKRGGGDMVEIIKKTASDIAAKVDTQKEIALVITSKRFEQNIMNVVPMGMIAYISLTSGGMLDPLYGNAAGIIIMTVCLGLYGFAFVLSRKIMDIKV